MFESKLYTILANFNKYELNRIRKYITSPYFNKNKELIQLFDVLTKETSPEHETLSKEQVWQKIHEGENPTGYDDTRMRKYQSDLLKLIESYLAQEIYEENPVRQAHFLVEAVARKRMIKLYKTVMKSARLISERQYFKSANFFYHQYQIEKSYYDILTHEKKRLEKTNVEAIADNLDKFYLAEKLRYYCSVLATRFIQTHDYQLLFIDEIIAHIDKYQYADTPPIIVYYSIYLTYKDSENDDYFSNLKNVINENIKYFPSDEANEIYTYALNFCVGKINRGHQQYLQEYFDMYQNILEDEVIDFSDEELGPYHFRNINICALRLGKFDWVEKFITKYKDQLPPELKENAISFNMAQLHFYKKEYDKVLRLLSQVEYEDFTYNLNSKVFLMKTYFELDEIEPLYSLLESFRVFLNRTNKLTVQRRLIYQNMIKLVKKLTKIRHGDLKSIEKFKKEMDQVKGQLIDEEWIKEKLSELQ